MGVSGENGEEANANGQVIANQTGGFNEDATSGQALGGVNESNVGGGQSVNNIQPYQCVNFIIALEGTYPSRN